MEVATFGAGCFWGIEEDFRILPGILTTRVGFMGGHVDKPSYERVCQGDTGHAEVVHLTFDPSVISYEKLLDRFWEIHDPTQVNRQGPDVGYQYRSVIFFRTEEQKKLAEKSKQTLNDSKKYTEPIATAIEKESMFFEAEEYHQHYVLKGGVAACRV